MNLAIDYRPKKFSEILGNPAAVTIIQKILETGFESPLLLYSDLAGVGKTTLARLIANEVSSPVDTTEFDAATAGGIDNVRRIKEEAGFMPLQGKMRLFIIDEAHSLSKAAEEGLLKTLEDKPKEVNFILCTTNREKIKNTIRTRCNEIEVFPPRLEELVIFLKRVVEEQKLQVSDTVLNQIGMNCNGQVREALKTLENVSRLPTIGQQLTLVKKFTDERLMQWSNILLYGSHSTKVTLANKLINLGFSKEVILTSILHFFTMVRIPIIGEILAGCAWNPEAKKYIIAIYDSEIEYLTYLINFIWKLRQAELANTLFVATLPLLTHNVVLNERPFTMPINFTDADHSTRVEKLLKEHEKFKDAKFENFQNYVKVTTKNGAIIEISASGEEASGCSLVILYPLGVEQVALNKHMRPEELGSCDILLRRGGSGV